MGPRVCEDHGRGRAHTMDARLRGMGGGMGMGYCVCEDTGRGGSTRRRGQREGDGFVGVRGQRVGHTHDGRTYGREFMWGSGSAPPS